MRPPLELDDKAARRGVVAYLRYFVHNVVAHPLLVIWPRLGAWLHDRVEL